MDDSSDHDRAIIILFEKDIQQNKTNNDKFKLIINLIYNVK